MTIAGSDSGGGAGIQADLLSFAANGVFGTTVLTCLTAQHPGGVTAVAVLEPGFVAAQLLQVWDYFRPAAAKTGMLYNAEIIEAVADFAAEHPALPLVVDTVMVATSGAVLLHPAAIAALRNRLLPRAAVLTPNLDEADVLLGWRPATVAEMERAAAELSGTFGVPVLLKGGHLEGRRVVDLLACPDGAVHRYEGERIEGVNTHGSGCTLSAAIAAWLARGTPLPEAVGQAVEYLRRGLRAPLTVAGERFINHVVCP